MISNTKIRCLTQRRFQEFVYTSEHLDVVLEYHLVQSDSKDIDYYKLLSQFKITTNFPSYSAINCKPLASSLLKKFLLNCKKNADQISVELREDSAVVIDFTKHRIDVFQTRKNLDSIEFARVGPYLFSCFLHDFDSIMLHSSSVAYSDKAAIFLGMDDGGKTTAASLCTNGTVLADDQAIFKKDANENWRVHGTPFSTFEPNTDSATPRAFFLLEKAKSFALTKLSSQDLFIALWNEHSRSRQIPTRSRTALFNLYLSLSSSAPVYLMKFPKDYIDQEAILKCLDH